jgi:hypothetical protein
VRDLDMIRGTALLTHRAKARVILGPPPDCRVDAAGRHDPLAVAAKLILTTSDRRLFTDIYS